jgi:hypothetical protein
MNDAVRWCRHAPPRVMPAISMLSPSVQVRAPEPA